MYIADNVSILDKIDISDDIYMLRLSNEQKVKYRSGQFINIKVSDSDYPLLRRPISIAEVDDGGIKIYIKKVGSGTNLLHKRKIGDSISIVAPLGNGFDLNEVEGRCLVVGAGIGVAPMLQLTKELKDKGLVVDVVLGFKDTAYMIDEFKKYASKLTIVSENTGYDYKGYVTEGVDRELKKINYDHGFVCGPNIAMSGVNKLMIDRDINPQLLMEEKMACGFGACLVCTCKIGNEEEYEYKRTCKDGPVFLGKEVVFNE